MSSLKQSIFWLGLYIAIIYILAQFDYADAPIIDFAKYFYFLVIIEVPITLFFPLTSKVSVYVPIIVWGSVYLVLLQVVDRSVSAPNTTFPIVILEFILVILGVWLAYQLAYGISHAESVMDAMALSAFPNRTQSLEDGSGQVKMEIARSRRYHRPLGMLVLQINPADHFEAENLIFSVQHDLSSRFSFARIGQVIDEFIRQTDSVFRDRSSRFVVLCPETDFQNLQILAVRIADSIKHRTGVKVNWGAVSFPDDALNFDDLLDVARARLSARVKGDQELPEPEIV